MWKMFINSVLNVGAFYKKNRLYFVFVYCLNKIIVFVCVSQQTAYKNIYLGISSMVAVQRERNKIMCVHWISVSWSHSIDPFFILLTNKNTFSTINGWAHWQNACLFPLSFRPQYQSPYVNRFTCNVNWIILLLASQTTVHWLT